MNTIYPGAAEVTGDNIDQSCDGSEECYIDADNDTYRLTTTFSSADADCNDSTEALASDPTGECNDGNGAVNPGATEICDGIDNDCDATTDEGFSPEIYYLDSDGDGWSNGSTIQACSATGSYYLPNQLIGTNTASSYLSTGLLAYWNFDNRT